MLAGEWSILEPGNRCIALPTKKGITVKVSPSEHITVYAPDIDSKKNSNLQDLNHAVGEFNSQKFIFVRCAIDIVQRYFFEHEKTSGLNPPSGSDRPAFALEIFSDISFINLPDGSCVKLGLGSSAATVVGVISALFEFYKSLGFSTHLAQDKTKNDQGKKSIFKLSCIAHSMAQGGVGSCYDVAVCSYGVPLVYTRFDELWFKEKLQLVLSKQSHTGEIDTRDFICKSWPGLQIEPIILPKKLYFCLGFVGYSASTKNLLSQVKRARSKNRDSYKKVCDEINTIVQELVVALQKCEYEKILLLITKNRELLWELEKILGITLETPELKLLCDIAKQAGGAGKLSGAGGGDCGIAMCLNQAIARDIAQAWHEHGIVLLSGFL